MNHLLITYDLCGPNKNYEELIDKIERFPFYAKINKSSWLIATNKGSEQVRDELLAFLDRDDRLFVGRLSGEAAWRNAECGNTSINNLFKK